MYLKGAWGRFLQWQKKLVWGTFSKTIGYFETGEVIILIKGCARNEIKKKLICICCGLERQGNRKE